ncbi:MAG: hypothetical protein UR61_C0032G0005 [candidate division WS6 bacterium GW2011_GWE1_34_7]|uniref:Uncharacterized protein n=1 Tax=candidate division WS6 bacterium GW2011_GWE1_34_7 TaxID=1619093 RepID=A0A0G0BNC5_9BACT|nr:MAG: hypothetical protein UR61_C0032G0005 [candidate division WS6 bacterium GW2011_GWE1_34_7]
MKTILLLLTFIVAINVNSKAQWEYRAYSKKSTYNFKKDLNITAPIAIMIGGFTYNEINLHSDEFAGYTDKQRNQTMLTGYLLTAILSTGTHYIWKGIQNKKHHRRFFYH